MKVVFMAFENADDDGRDSEISIVKENMIFVEDFEYGFTQFLNAIGFTYVDGVTIHKENNDR
jgi:hypothetical protein